MPTTQASRPPARLNGSWRSITQPPRAHCRGRGRADSLDLGAERDARGLRRADRADDAEAEPVVDPAGARAPGRLAGRRDRPVGLPDQHGRVQQHEGDAGPPVGLPAREAVVEAVEDGHRVEADEVHPRVRAVHDRVPDAGVEDHDRSGDREDVRGVGRDRRDRVLLPEERRGDQRLAQPALLPARLLDEEALELVGHVRGAERGRLVDDARALEQHVRERAVVAERGLAAEERLRLPARQHLEQAIAAVGREAAGGAGHAAEDRLGALDHAEGHEVAHLLEQREDVVGAVLDVGVAGHRRHPVVAERLDDLAQGVGLERRVRVDEAHDLGLGRADARGHRRALAAVVGEADRVQVREAPRRERHALPGRVGRAVVDGEHGEQVLRVVEREDGGERRLDRGLLVHGRDHDGDGRELIRAAAHGR